MTKKESSGSPYCAAYFPEGLTAALGSFDGVHLGHAELIGEAVKNARERGRASAVWTFSDESSSLPGKQGMRSITTLGEKLELFAELGADYALLADFGQVRDLSPREFVEGMLKRDCGVRTVVCGFNFSFGKGGAGDPAVLSELMGEENCIIVPPVCVDGSPVSSSAIRRLIESGDAEEAAKLLGRPFFIDFPVVHGKELGRTIGLPTINQDFPAGHVIPEKGIYACLVDIGDRSYPGVSNVGTRPTVDNSGRINCETHIIGYSGWLYGENIKVSFYKRLRGEKKFPDVASLKAQIERDAASALEYFRAQEVK